MKYILILFCFTGFAQTDDYKGQALFTQPQLDEINTRLEDETTNYYSSGAGFFGDGAEIMNGAAVFLSQEIAGTWANEFDWGIAPHVSGESGKEPRPGANTGAGSGNSGTRDVERIHDAGVLSLVWAGRNESATFNGATKTKNLHSIDLARNAWDVLLRRANDTNLDWSNRTNHPLDGNLDINPRFIIAAKMLKYINTFAAIEGQLGDYTSFTNNRTVVEDWFQDCADYNYQQFGIHLDRIFLVGINDYPPYSNNEFTTAIGTYPNMLYQTSSGVGNPDPFTQLHTYYNSAGTGFNTTTWMQAAGLPNRVWDAIGIIGAYGVMWNNPTYITFEEEMFKLFFEVGIFPDGTVNEWYRSYDGSPSQGLNYGTVTGFHLVSAALRHAVGVRNGMLHLTGGEGKLFNITTSRGTSELYANGYAGTTTSGGTKGLLAFLLNLSKYYKSSSNGGWNDLRFAEGGTAIDEENKPFTIMYAMANSFYNNSELEDLYKGLNGFTAPNYYSNGFTINASGSWGEHSLQPWGVPSSYGRYIGLAEMEDVTFSETTTGTPTTGYNSSILTFFVE